MADLAALNTILHLVHKSLATHKSAWFHDNIESLPWLSIHMNQYLPYNHIDYRNLGNMYLFIINFPEAITTSKPLILMLKLK